ncbi:hypothetical protein DSECCO2_470440 [anaerobic digester metagenome]
MYINNLAVHFIMSLFFLLDGRIDIAGDVVYSTAGGHEVRPYDMVKTIYEYLAVHLK